jgi:hypothetical protein
MDTERIRDDVMIYLGLTGPIDRSRVEFAVNSIVENILTSAEWSFLKGDSTLSVTSSQSRYKLAKDFLYPLSKDSFCEPDGIIEVVEEGWLNNHYPNKADIDGVRFAILYGREVKFHRVNDLSSTLTVSYDYQKRGNTVDLDFDPGFMEIVRNGTIKNVAKAGSAEQMSAAGFYRDQLEKKANLYRRKFTGESRFQPTQRQRSLQSQRKSMRW